jgi:hypothetical protein
VHTGGVKKIAPLSKAVIIKALASSMETLWMGIAPKAVLMTINPVLPGLVFRLSLPLVRRALLSVIIIHICRKKKKLHQFEWKRFPAIIRSWPGTTCQANQPGCCRHGGNASISNQSDCHEKLIFNGHINPSRTFFWNFSGTDRVRGD